MTDDLGQLDDPNSPINRAYPIQDNNKRMADTHDDGERPEKGFTIKVHNHGHVRFLDSMGTDTDIVGAARVSYDSPSKGEEKDKKLLGYLLAHKHTSPFEMCKIKFDIKMPIFVMRQYIRHRCQNVNEVSARYTELPNEFFVPETWRAQDTKNKQGGVESQAIDSDFCEQKLRIAYDHAYQTYRHLLLVAGVAREQARIVLPVGIYTQFHCCWDMNNLLKYFALRDDPHAQGEHQDYAKAMKVIATRLFPWTMEFYERVRKRLEATQQLIEVAKKLEQELHLTVPPEKWLLDELGAALRNLE